VIRVGAKKLVFLNTQNASFGSLPAEADVLYLNAQSIAGLMFAHEGTISERPASSE
jgi:hypothetical protein